MSETMVSKYKNRNKKDLCPRCSAKVAKDAIKAPLIGLLKATGKAKNNRFYGGNVKRFSLTECPVCKAELLLFLKAVPGSGWRIHDIGIEDDVLTAPYEADDNVVEAEVPKVNQEDAMELSGAIEETDDTVKTLEEIDIDHAELLVKSIQELDVENALEAMKGLSFGSVPKTLERAGIPHDVVYNNGGFRKKAEYITIITDHITAAIATIAATVADNEEQEE